mmetsp:Transcript_71447/g.180630  ORF Transcript_71447/g.180630 Transcript_71447/m.180630 type:complete len:281 (-) Transcript_71447:112-954(-)
MAVAVDIPVTLHGFAHEVLCFREARAVETLVDKLMQEGLRELSELGRVPRKVLEAKLSTNAAFCLGEITDAMLLCEKARERLHPKPLPTARRATPEGRRKHRSRSPKQGRGGAGRRENSRPLRVKSEGGTTEREAGRGPREAREEAPKPHLWAAVENGDEARVRQLLEQGSDAEERYQGWTPLMKAAEEDFVEIVRLLLDKKVDIEAVNRKKRSALSFAAAPSNRDNERRETAVSTLRLLLERGADTTRNDCTGKRPKERAAKEGRTEAVDVFDEFERRR